MTVYVLESSDERGEDHRLHGVFSTFEKACRANEILDIAGEVTEVELDEIEVRDPDRPDVRQLVRLKV